MTPIPKIDIHAHAVPWPTYTPAYTYRNAPPLTPAQLFEQYYDKTGVSQCVLLPLASPEGLPSPTTSEMMKYLCDADPDRLFWFCHVDPRALTNSPTSKLDTLLEHFKALGAKGVGEITANLYTDDPLMENLFACCEALHLPVTIHIAPHFGGGYGIVDERGLPRLERILKAHPDLIVLGHSQPFWSEIGENTDANRNTYIKGKVQNGRLPALLREYGNLYCDLSAGSGANALMRDREYAARFIEEFSDRLLYGQDAFLPGLSFPFVFDEFLTLMRESGEISEENYRKMVRGNAERVLALT